MKRKVLIISIALLAFFAALGITVYPLISTAYNQQHQSQIHTQYQALVEQVDNSAILQAKELAKAYNEVIGFGTQIRD